MAGRAVSLSTVTIEIHLILNHIPMIGVAFVSVELLIGLVSKNTFLQKVSLYFLIAFAVICVAVYFSGLGSEDLVKNLPGVSKAYLQLHEKVARISSFTVWFVGGLTILGLVCLRGRDALFDYFVRGVFAMSLLSTALFVLTDYLAGQITHAEIRSTLAEGLSTRALSIGVMGTMAVILLVMLLPLFFKRDKIFQKAGQHPADPTVDRQGQLWQGNQIPVGRQDGGSAIAPAWERPSQHAGEHELFIGHILSGPIGQQLSQTAFLPSRPQRKDLPDALGGHEHRPSSEESTRSLPIAPITLESLPPTSLKPKRLKGRKGLLVALSLLIMLVVVGGLGLAVLHVRKPAALPLQTHSQAYRTRSNG